MKQNPDKLNWDWLSKNPNAIHLLEQNPDKINWDCLSGNPNAIHLLEQNPDKIVWCYLSSNPNAIPLLEQNPDKIDCLWLSENPNLLQLLTTIDYAVLKEKNKAFAEELVKHVFHPCRIVKQSAAFGMTEMEYLEIM